MEFRIDDELKNLLPSLTEEEEAELEKDIKEEGRARDALIVWKEEGVLIDGHNRHRICTKLGLTYRVEEKSFPDRAAVIGWMVRTQLGRRNVTPEKRNYLQGKHYLEEKKPTGKPPDANVPNFSTLAEGTADRLAAEYGVGASTIRNNAAFAAQVDAIASVAGEDAKAVLLSGKATAGEIKDLAGKTKEELEKELKEIKTRKKKRRKKKPKSEAGPSQKLCDRCARLGSPACPACREQAFQTMGNGEAPKPETKAPPAETKPAEPETIPFNFKLMTAKFSELERLQGRLRDMAGDGAECRECFVRLNGWLQAFVSWQGKAGQLTAAETQQALFETFWAAYPLTRRVGKPQAEKNWKKLSPDPETVREMLKSLELWKQSEQWNGEPKHIPHPGTWISDRRWETPVEAILPHKSPKKTAEQVEAEAAAQVKAQREKVAAANRVAFGDQGGKS